MGDDLVMMKKLGACFIALFTLPTFTILTVAFAGCSVFLVTVGLLRMLGANIGMNLLVIEVPRLLSLPVAIIFGIGLLYLSKISWKTLKSCYHIVISAFKV